MHRALTVLQLTDAQGSGCGHRFWPGEESQPHRGARELEEGDSHTMPLRACAARPPSCLYRRQLEARDAGSDRTFSIASR